MGFLKGLMQAAIWLGVLGGIVAALLKVFFVDTYTVPHNGMAPTTVYGDTVALWRHASPDMGDMMLCEHPSEPGTMVFGRVTALPGHTLSTDHFGNLFLDSERWTTNGVGDQRFYDVTQDRLYEMQTFLAAFGTLPEHLVYREKNVTFELRPTEVTQGLFLLGDNFASPATDSREFGVVDPVSCKGQVFLRLKPAPKNDDDLDNGYLDLLR